MPSAPRPTVSAPKAPSPSPPPSPPRSDEPSKPAAEDRIGKVGTTYEPVRLSVGKLKNRWNPAGNKSDDEEDRPSATGPSLKERMAAFSGGGAPKPSSSPPKPAGGKLTWSQRQALAKKQQEEEEERSRAASANRELTDVLSKANDSGQAIVDLQAPVVRLRYAASDTSGSFGAFARALAVSPSCA